MDMKPNELWEEIYGDKEYSFDFANKLIIKKEFKTKSQFSWNAEQYDFEDETFFIANLETINIRDKRSIFEIGNDKYIITKNPDYSYTILSTTSISDEKCPINFDLFLNYKINNYEKKDYSFIVISLKKMNKDALNIFTNYIIEYLKIYKELISFDIDDSNFSRTEIKFQFIINSNFDEKNTLDIALTISSLMPLIIYRLNSLSIGLWISNIEETTYFNIFVSSKKSLENYFKLKDVGTLGMISGFENLIFINKELKIGLSKNNDNQNNNFVKAKNSEVEGIYEYKYLRNDISQYNEIIFRKK